MTLPLAMATHKRAPKRATVYFDPSLHKALRVKAAETERSLSELVNAAVRQSLAEDSEDLAAFQDRVQEPSLAFAAVLKDLKRRGKL
jgi:plasmid stability protein